MSTTIADYKESERIPAELASAIEDMYEDGKAIHKNYSTFDLDAYRKQLRQIARSFSVDVRHKRHSTRIQVYKLNQHFSAMESAKVPPNFIVKLKQQQSQILRVLARVTYIQRIMFIPSARILARSIIPLTLSLLLFTRVDPIVGGLIITAAISFILVYILQLIQVISTPFHGEGKTQDDVSLFLIDETTRHLK